MKYINQKTPFQCKKCRKLYSTKSSFKAHMNVSHEKVKRYQCYFCSVANFTKSLLIRHMLNHTMEKPYKCQYCFQWYKSKESVTKHKDGKACIRQITYPSLSPCYFCGKVSSNRQCLMSHMKSVHLKEASRRCNLCYKYFSSPTIINHHIRTVHLLEKMHKCQLCSKKLGSSSELSRHIRSVHTNEKPFKCYFCSKSFVDFDLLKMHMSIHTREKPLTCYFCRKDFSTANALSVHIRRIHTKETPFKCIQCPSRYYSTKWDVNVHVRIKHGHSS
jgi:KRAB domain-containing zinc finger protein